VTEAKIGWFAAELAIGTLVTLLVRLTLFPNRPDLALRLMRRSMAAREATALRLAAKLMQAPAPASRFRKSATLLGLNETSLMLEHRATLVSPQGHQPSAALARSSYLADLATSHLLQLIDQPGTAQLPLHLRTAAAAALRAVADGDPDSATALLEDADRWSNEPADDSTHLTQVRDALRHVVASRAPHPAAPLTAPAVPFIGGWLPGSLLASGQASRQSLPKRLDRVALAAPLRSAIQMVLAMTAAIAAGDALNGQRFYWAMLAVFVAFMGGSNSYENMQRALARVAGTTVGIFLGFAAVHIVGHHDGAAIALILLALFIGFYITRFGYFFFVICITIMVSELYAEFGEFSHHLLYVRVEETAIGGAIAVITLMFVVPLRRERVFTVALGNYLTALQNFLHTAHHRPVQGDPRIDLHPELRSIDHAYHTLQSIDPPRLVNRLNPAARHRTRVLAVADQARHAARGWTQQAAPAPSDATAQQADPGGRSDTTASALTGRRQATVQPYLSAAESAAREIAAELSASHPDRAQLVAT
jgi:uncharacterized membrane protein YccC